ncbi:MAG: DUF1836 domain-containing protein [Negativicutes bacterium]|nr:DUF1836 domain-containing protein [Negativicutes bacterium]
MEKDILAELSRKIREADEIPLETIPDIELYMDQLLTFLNQRLATPGSKPDGQIFTRTMINNYTKDRVLIPPKNKKYSKQHILLLILIHNLKGILSISDIKRLFEPILRDISTPDDDLLPLEDIYTAYLDLMENYLAEFSENFSQKLAFINAKVSNLEGDANVGVAKLFLSVLMLTAQASLSKKMAELIIAGFFPATATNEDTARLAYDINLDAVLGQAPKDMK